MSFNRILIFAATGILLVIIGVLGWYSWLVLNNPQPPDESAQKTELLDRAYSQLSSGDYQGALEEAIKLTGDANPSVSIRAQRVVNEANFLIGTKESRIVAVQGAKSLFTRLEGYPEDQALVITSLLNYMSMAPDSYIYNEIFAPGPFSALVVENDYLSTVKNLAEYSMSLKPTTTALVRVGWWHADKILEVSRRYGLDDAAKKAAADEILKIISESQVLITKEIASGEPLNPMMRPNFYFWQASLYQAVARVYPKYIDQAGDSLSALRYEYESTRRQDGGYLATIAVLIPYAELYYTQALYEVEGETSLPRVKDHLVALIETVEANPDIHRAGFIGMIERQSSLLAQYRIFNHPTYVRFIEQVPEFRIFLESYGWSAAAE